jgi:hypothetical protein
LLFSHAVKVQPKRKDGWRLIANDKFRVSQNNGWRTVDAVVRVTQQHSMGAANAKQFRRRLVCIGLPHICQRARLIAADQVQHLALRTHATDVVGVFVVGVNVDQLALVRMPIWAVPAGD